MNLRSKEVVQQQIAGAGGRFLAAQNENRPEPKAGRGRRRLARVVGLCGPAGHQCVGPAGQRLTHQEFQLAGFVAAGRQSGQVIPLDQDRGSLQMGAQPLQSFNRGR